LFGGGGILVWGGKRNHLNTGDVTGINIRKKCFFEKNCPQSRGRERGDVTTKKKVGFVAGQN